MHRLFVPLSIALGLSLGAASAPAVAAPQHLFIGDLNFERPADVVLFKARLGAVQDALCGPAPKHARIGPGLQACREGVEEEAAAKLPATEQKAYFANRGAAPRNSALADRGGF